MSNDDEILEPDEVLDADPDLVDDEPIADDEFDPDDPLARRKGESRISHGYLMLYAQQDQHKRSIADLATQVDRTRGQLYTHSRRWDWQARIDAFDHKKRRIFEETARENYRKLGGTMLRAANIMANKVLIGASQIDETKLTVPQIARLADAVVKISTAPFVPAQVDDLEAMLDQMPTGPSTLESPGVRAIENLTDQPEVLEAILAAFPEDA